MDELGDWEQWIIQDVCKIEYNKYFKNRSLLTMKILESHLDDAMKRIERMKANIGNPPEYGEIIFSIDQADVAYQILAMLILETGSYLPEKVKKEVLRITEWEYDKKWGWTEINVRKFYLKEFRDKLMNHIPGQRHRFINLKLNTDEEFKKCSVGLKAFRELLKKKKIREINYINLDNCELKQIPEEIFKLRHIKRLSLVHNSIESIPDDIGKLKSLKELYLADNKIKELPHSIGDLKSLEILNLSQNKIEELPKTIKNLEKLYELALYNNPLSKYDLPESFLPPKIAYSIKRTKKLINGVLSQPNKKRKKLVIENANHNLYDE